MRWHMASAVFPPFAPLIHLYTACPQPTTFESQIVHMIPFSTPQNKNRVHISPSKQIQTTHQTLNKDTDPSLTLYTDTKPDPPCEQAPDQTPPAYNPTTLVYTPQTRH